MANKNKFQPFQPEVKADLNQVNRELFNSLELLCSKENRSGMDQVIISSLITALNKLPFNNSFELAKYL
jgi:hypothetical protein